MWSWNIKHICDIYKGNKQHNGSGGSLGIEQSTKHYSFHTFIYSFIFSNHFILDQDHEPNPRILGVWWEYNLDEAPVHLRIVSMHMFAFSFTPANLEFPSIQPYWQVFLMWEKPENLKEHIARNLSCFFFLTLKKCISNHIYSFIWQMDLSQSGFQMRWAITGSLAVLLQPSVL